MAGPYRRYDKRQKVAAVIAAEISGVTVVAEQTGIPHQTLSYWMARPEFGEVRRRTREDLADEIKVVAHKAWQRLAETVDEMEPRDAVFAAEKATTLYQLLTGSATARTESRDISGSLPDSSLVHAIREAVSITSRGGASPEAAIETEGEGL